ncbi:MAG: putative Signal transduction histidine kinase [Promethearchaeota archaeon]|nr:MAG: putative Signal transduction histidine kinase [Candidatus Lokiarchaeota archaeon]
MNKFYEFLKDFLEKLNKDKDIENLSVNDNQLFKKILFINRLLKLFLKEKEKSVEEIIQNGIIEEFYLNSRKKNKGINYFRTIIENIPSIVSVLDENFQLEYINSAQEEISGFSKDEILGKRTLDWVYHEDRKNLAKFVKKLFKAGYANGEYRMRCKDGTYVWLEGHGKFIEKGKEKKIVISANDITYKKYLERKNKETREELELSKKKLENLNKNLGEIVLKRTEKLRGIKERFQIITEYASDMIMIFNRDMVIEYINENALYNILGYDAEEIVNKQRNDLIHPKHKKKLKIFSQDFDELDVYTEEIRVRHKDGNYVWIEAKGRKFRDKDGEVKAMMILRDISEHKELQKELRKVSDIKSQFLRRISHELKTPLISIKGNIELIFQNHSKRLNKTLENILNEIKFGSERLEKFVYELIEASKLESGDVEINKKVEDLNFLVRFVIDNLNWLINSRKHELIINLQNDVKAKFEKERIFDVINNLLTNAIKFTPPSGTITISTERKDDCVIFSIKDTGIGFTKEERTEIFKRFGKIERFGQGFDLQVNGSGLGLYIAKKIIELHGGKIWMTSEGRNKGSTFYFSLPIGDE